MCLLYNPVLKKKKQKNKKKQKQNKNEEKQKMYESDRVHCSACQWSTQGAEIFV